MTEIEGNDEESVARLITCGKVSPEFLESYIHFCNDGKHPKMMAVLLDYQNETLSSEKKEEIANKAIGFSEMSSKDWKKIYRWTEEQEGIVINKYKGIDAEVVIPSQIDGKPVIKIGKNAFKKNDHLQIIRIPNTVTEILESAFENCPSLSEIQWSENLLVIEKRAFYWCRMLKGTLTLPQTIKSIGVNAFQSCYYSEIILPEGLELIGSGALNCANITELHIPESVRDMSDCIGCFEGDLYIHGMETKLKEWVYRGMPISIYAPAGSYTAKCAEKGIFVDFHML